ncbi:hypothetical protein ACERIM_11415 [Natrinema sp. H-ect1]|uniref:hypothetical protein n=1 Tax=Natrinema sp. H-ect1 TaxID=3242700 RepID=UPI00359CEAC7
MEYTEYVGILRIGLAFLGGGILTAILSSYIDLIKERQQALRQDVFDPIYDEIVRVVDGELPYESGEFKSEWEDLDPHKKYGVNENTRKNLKEYSDYISDYDKLVDYLRKSIRQKGEKEGTQVFLQTNNNSMIVLPTVPSRSSNIFADNFVNQYAPVLLKSKTAEDLEENLKKFAVDNNRTDKRDFRAWPSEYYTEIWDSVEEAEEEWLEENGFDGRFELFREIQTIATEIRPHIESQMDNVRSWRYWFPSFR